jgi:type I restriction enzyme S subunit
MLSDKIIRLKTKPDMLPAYVVLAFASAESQEYFKQRKTGLAESQVNISREKILRLPLKVPPISEQRRIVAHLDALQTKADALRSLQSETASALDALLPAVLVKAFAGKL